LAGDGIEVLLMLLTAHRSDEPGKHIPVDEFQWLTVCKPPRFLGVNTTGDENGTVGAISHENPIQFTNPSHVHLVNLPLLALDEMSAVGQSVPRRVESKCTTFEGKNGSI
jgi:hypothetical protein